MVLTCWGGEGRRERSGVDGGLGRGRRGTSSLWLPLNGLNASVGVILLGAGPHAAARSPPRRAISPTTADARN
jgi:hypothetical protein